MFPAAQKSTTNKNNLPKFIVLEGVDGSGKTTAAHYIAQN